MAHEETLAHTDFFADASPDALNTLAAAGQELHLIRGDVLFNEGDPPESLYLVLRGRLAIALANPIDRRESVVALMESGDLFGEMGMLDDGPRSAMARALEPTTVLSIPYPHVLGMFDENPKLLWNVVRLLASESGSPTKRWPTPCSSTSPAGRRSGSSNSPTAPTSSLCRSPRKSSPGWSAHHANV